MRKYHRIVLIGFRATGKSTIGRRLSALLNWEYFSTDLEVQTQTGVSIAELVDEKGWQHFRRQEHHAVLAATEKSSSIIDCGGGVVEDEKNMRLLAQNSLLVWVDADITDIYRRMSRDKEQRPLLDQSDLLADIESNYERRLPLYRKYAQLRVDSSYQTLEDVCRKIMEYLDNDQQR